jgi:hypothetical protein
MLWACTTSTEEALADINDLMDMLGVSVADRAMTRSLRDATAWVERHVLNNNGVMRRQVYGETVAGYGTQRLRLSRWPVLGVQRLFLGTDTGTATEYSQSSWRVEDPDAGFLELTSDAGFAWDAVAESYMGVYPRPASVVRPWYVVYEAGWQVCSSSTSADWVTTSTGRTLPEDVERAVVMKAAELYQGSMQGVGSIKVGPLELNYRSVGSDAAQDPVVDILAPYRRL